MATMSLKHPDDLKVRTIAASATDRLGVTPHAFKVGAIREATAAAQDRASFIDAAQAARRQALKSGSAFDADEVHEYLIARVAGLLAKRPKATRWRD
jgi:hypothetical protein